MRNKHTDLPLKVRRWGGEKWPERRVSIADDNGHALFISARYADIEKAEIQAGEIATAVNYHHRLREALRLAVDFINKHPADPDITSEQVQAWQKLVNADPDALLAELDKMEPKQ